MKPIQDDWVLEDSLEKFIDNALGIGLNYSKNLARLFSDGNETAFVARYKTDSHGNLPPEKVRRSYEVYQSALELNKKVGTAIKTIGNKITDAETRSDILNHLRKCKRIGEVTEISKSFATGSRKTKAAEGKAFNLEIPAKSILDGKLVNLKSLTNSQLSEKDMEIYLIAIIADIINKDQRVIEYLGKLSHLEIKNIRMTVTSKLKQKISQKVKNQDSTVEANLKHFETYINYSKNVHYIESYQVLGLNRTEEKELINWTVEVDLNAVASQHPFYRNQLKIHKEMLSLYKRSLDHSIEKLFIPKLQRATKRFLSERADDDSIKCFSENVQQLFAQTGISSKYIIALDPGYRSVKAAFLKPNGDLINSGEFGIRDNAFDKPGQILLKKWSEQTKGSEFEFTIGNGSNSYNTQSAVEKMIVEKSFKNPHVVMRVVPEDGASKYSITEAAKEEFGDMPIKEISAVSIGRRIISPVAEYVKIQPENLGKGMYQHSIDTKKLQTALEVVVRDLVSMRGVDLNTASYHLLKKVCGLNSKTAAEIIKYREKNGPFQSRKQLEKVNGIGEVTFTQCSGFLTIQKPDNWSDTTLTGKPAKRAKLTNNIDLWRPFDATTIHPHQYEIATKVLNKLRLEEQDVLNMEKFDRSMQKFDGEFSNEEKCVITILQTRFKLKPPPKSFTAVRKLSSLKVGEIAEGVVRNKTHFGIFVDIGVGQDGLCHVKNYRHHNQDIKDVEMPETGMYLQFKIDSIANGKISLVPHK